MLLAPFLLASTAFPQNAAPEEFLERQGPFSIAGQSFTLFLHGMRLANSRTLTLLEIRDAAGNVQYQKSFDSQVTGGAFQPRVSASARLVTAGGLAGLLVRYVRLPARPGTEESWQLFRLKDMKLALLDLLAAGPPSPFGFGAFAAARGANGAIPVPPPRDELELKVWTGNFYALVPAKVDWARGVITKGEQCLEVSGRGGFVEKGCDMRVESAARPRGADVSFVRMLQGPAEGGQVKHLVLKKDARIEYLRSNGFVNWTKSGDEILIRISDPWLHVLVDNSDDSLGWIHSDDDFSAVGLPPENATP
jgi:hypothetical protein